MWILEFENESYGKDYDELHKYWDLATHKIYKNQSKAVAAMKRQAALYPSLKFRVMEIAYVSENC